MLREEMRRVLVTLEYEACEWEGRVSIAEWRDVKGVKPSDAHAEGAAAYAHSQAAVRRRLRDQFAGLWREVGLPPEVMGVPKDIVEEVQPAEEMEEEEEDLPEELEGEVQEQVQAEEEDGLFR